MIKHLQSAVDSAFLKIDQLLDKPEELSPRMKERIHYVQLRFDFNQATEYKHRVLTKHGRIIYPFTIHKEHRERFRTQERVKELVAIIEQVAHRGDIKITLNPHTGKFYQNDDLIFPLGEIDVQTEKLLLKEAIRNVMAQKEERKNNPTYTPR